MAATVSIYFDFGGSDASPGTEQDVDGLGPPNIRFKAADDATIDTNNPLVIPTTGDIYSYWKHIYLYCDAPDSNSIDNLKFYSDGSNNYGTGVDLEVGGQFPSKTNAASAGYEEADDQSSLVSGHTGISSVASVFTYTSGSPLSGPTIGEAGGVIDAVGETSNYLLLQMKVSSTASPGELPVDETLTIKYDEQ